jgi:hypothetical protein
LIGLDINMRFGAEDEALISNAIPELIKGHIHGLENGALPVTADLPETIDLPGLPNVGIGTSETFAHIQSSILPNLAQGHAGPRYYGTKARH